MRVKRGENGTLIVRSAPPLTSALAASSAPFHAAYGGKTSFQKRMVHMNKTKVTKLSRMESADNTAKRRMKRRQFSCSYALRLKTCNDIAFCPEVEIEGRENGAPDEQEFLPSCLGR